MGKVFAIATVVVKELYRRKDFYVLFVLTALITLLMASANVFGDTQIVRYVKELCLLLIWISGLVIAIGTAARQIPAERESRTILPLLAKPVTRGQVVFGKFLGCWLACGIALVVFYVFMGVISGLKTHHWPVLTYLQALWLHWICLAVVVGMVLLGSIIFAAPSSNATICFIIVAGILGVGRHLNKVALWQTEPLCSIIYAGYYLIPHLEWYDIRDFVIHEQGLVEWLYCGIATVYGWVYTAFFLVAAWLLFRNKPLQ